MLNCLDDRIHLQLVCRIVALQAAQRTAEESHLMLKSSIIEPLLQNGFECHFAASCLQDELSVDVW